MAADDSSSWLMGRLTYSGKGIFLDLLVESRHIALTLARFVAGARRPGQAGKPGFFFSAPAANVPCDEESVGLLYWRHPAKRA
jgi:hypothetical protein